MTRGETVSRTLGGLVIAALLGAGLWLFPRTTIGILIGIGVLTALALAVAVVFTLWFLYQVAQRL